ncbi:radical SAM protein [Candidatus Poribacteria bacterium]|nr:radical SAM protein [Candidatus Poribacteria bacterium]
MSKDSYSSEVISSKYQIWKSSGTRLSKLDFEITERCNNNCIHCCINLPADDINAKEKELTTQEIKDILDEAASLGCLQVRYTGGEPLLREDFEDIYIYTRKLGIKVTFFTNATLIDENIIDLFKRIPPLNKIEITVYGMSKKSYEAVSRIPGSFDAFWSGVNLLLDNNIPFIVKSVLLPPNKNEKKEFEKWASTIPWMDTIPTYSIFFDLRYRHDLEKKDRLIKGLRPTVDEGMTLLTENEEEYIQSKKSFCARFMRPCGDKLFSCGAGVNSATLDAYGKLQMCMMLRHPDTVYDLRKGSLKEAMSEFFPKIRKMKAANQEYLDRCAKCFLKGLCEQCPGNSWVENVSLDSPVEYLCSIAHAQARYLGLLGEDEMGWEVENWKKRIDNFTKSGK